MMTTAADRKRSSENKLEQLDIPINPHLPTIESEAEAKLRSPEEVAKRAIALCAVALCGEGLEQQTAIVFLQERGLWEAATQKEKKFLLNKAPTQQERANFTWRYEGLWVLLWALGYVSQLAYPSEICDVPQAVETIANTPAEQFIAQASLRPLAEILEEADLIYRYDWAVVNARLQHCEMPGGLNQGVVYERHYALNWLVGYLDQDWDDVTTDT
jgi:hypothetical protein